MKKTNSSIVIITNKSKTHLLMQEYDDTYHIEYLRNKYNFFGGNIEKNEKPLDCILRELDEEINDSFLLYNIKNNIIYLNKYMIVYHMDDEVYCAHEHIFISVLDDAIFENLDEDINYSNEGIFRKLEIFPDLVFQTAWDSPYVIDWFFNLNTIEEPIAFEKVYNLELDSKIINRINMISLSAISPIIFIPGCYDLLHAGHMEFLKKIKEFKNWYVVIGVGSDCVIKTLKGENRPVQSSDLRLMQISQLPYVDYVLLNDNEMFDEEIDFEQIIKFFKPDYLAISSDNKNIKLNLDFCKRHNIEPYYVDRFIIEQLSTTEIINKCKQ